MKYPTVIIVAIGLACASSVNGQQGRADLQYRAPIPASMTYVSVDSTSATVSGLPTGSMSTVGHFRSVTEVSMSPTDTGFNATITLKELEGSTTTPMGEVPMDASDVVPFVIPVGRRGPNPEELAETPPAVGGSAGEMMGASKAFAGLLVLPGRELMLGETWTDTTTITPELEGMQTKVTTVTRGTYAADTVQDGVTLNVLRIATEMTMTMAGTVQGMAITQTMTSTSDERVLWNSEQHYVVARDAGGILKAETQMTDMGVTMNMTATTRSIITASAGTD